MWTSVVCSSCIRDPCTPPPGPPAQEVIKSADEMMDASCYVPNNPQYGLQLECQWNGVNTAGPTVHQHQHHHQQQHQHHTVGTCAPVHCNGIIQHVGNETELDPLSPSNQGCWTTPTGEPGDDMGSFSMPLDLDPLPTLFPFSPCASGVYKTESNCSPTVQSHPKEKPVHDMADVLLSLKHAVVHPGQTIDSGYHHHHQQQQPQQLSYTVHPHQMLMSPNGYAYCDQLPPPSYQTTSGHHQSGGIGGQVGPGPPMFPSMSVNVSMNMTYHPSTIPGYDQVQWGTTPQTTSPSAYAQNQNSLLSPSYAGGTTYSFTADFRPPNVQDVPLITSSSFKPVINTKAQFPPIRNVKKMEYVSPGKMHMVCQEDESQRPNLCRICGKTYARPSTLKTHLRTHSGEKPYRCLDCNKSFSQAANLTAHVRTHSGEKPFRCPICDRRFSQSSSVTTHMRTHSGERPYRCRMCKKAFSDSSTLTKHLRIHSGEKPYQCKLCLLRFSQSGNLNRHMRVHGTNNQMLV